MGQDALMTDELDSGRQLVERLNRDGFAVYLAFWLKETDAGQWFLYLASPVVDEKGGRAAYGALLPTIQAMPELAIDLFAVKLVGMNDSMTTAAQRVINAQAPNGPFAVHSPKPYPRITRFGGSTLGGIDIDGAYIYPPYQPAASP